MASDFDVNVECSGTCSMCYVVMSCHLSSLQCRVLLNRYTGYKLKYLFH